MTIQDLKQQCSSTIFHEIHWANTTIQSGFNKVSLPTEMEDAQPFQLAITSGTGRMHGLLIDHYFYIIWFDPSHKLCPRR